MQPLSKHVPNPRLNHASTVGTGGNGSTGSNQRYNYENRVVQAHRELQQFFRKFDTENENDIAETGESHCSQLKSSRMEDGSDKEKKSDK